MNIRIDNTPPWEESRYIHGLHTQNKDLQCCPSRRDIFHPSSIEAFAQFPKLKQRSSLIIHTKLKWHHHWQWFVRNILLWHYCLIISISPPPPACWLCPVIMLHLRFRREGIFLFFWFCAATSILRLWSITEVPRCYYRSKSDDNRSGLALSNSKPQNAPQSCLES